MKRLNYLIITALIAAVMMICFTSCTTSTTTPPPAGNGGGGGNTTLATGSSDITISEPVFGFISEDEYDPSTSVIDTSKKWTSLDVDKAYYLFLSFDVNSVRDNDGQSLLDVKITFDSIDVMEGTIEDVGTGNIQNLIITDAGTGNVGRTTTASFKIPAFSSETKTIEMIVKLSPVNIGESHIIISYNYDSDCNLLGSDGYTKNLEIKQVKIETPELNVNGMGLLSWEHVKNAEYYKIYENNEEVRDENGEPIVVRATDYSVGSEIVYNIGNLVTGYHYFTIRAFSNNSNLILPSDHSNSAMHEW